MPNAAHSPGIEAPVTRYFQEFLPGLFGRLLIADLESLSTRFAIEVTDLAAPAWRIEIEAGRIVRVEHDGPEPSCTFRLDGATLLEVAAAKVLPAEAFFAKRIDLEGDMELGLKLSTVLAPFFEGFPFHG
ncbi:MAG: SCP2 sterol-binding domain-containing protein [Deltaproteobacteria bacterium]|nr:SCP2 sterol-binding domain-containing protein [Deltaproteobacteria bacterium]MBW2446900.1 SCP2 sterol-binding domain-containing protein [Deltaproteobacteria bacterium]